KAKKSVKLMMEKLFRMELELMLVTQNEAVHKELGDSLVRAATTASSLEAEQDSGNINKTQSKATPNESSSQGTNSGGGPRCQETMGDTIAQTRVESSGDEESLDEDASKQGRINAIDTDEEITLVRQNENVVEEVVDVAQVSTAATTVTITTEEINLAQALEALKTSKPKAKIKDNHELSQRLQAEEQEELSIEEKAKLFQQLLEQRRKHFAAK
ncbi:hypothetical protein Tco_1388958, partial [Tanacetum coccineum]